MLSDDYYREKLRAGVRVTDRGCWEWQGYRHVGNYGQVGYMGKAWSTHRLAFHLFKGALPPKACVCHTCDNKGCCNPDHLWIGDRAANNRDTTIKGRHSRHEVTHCANGHAYAEYATIRKDGSRDCRMCQRIRQRIKAGWPEHLARTLPLVPHGIRVVGADYKSKRKAGRPAPKTHCKRGHLLDEANVYYKKDGRRRCRKCHVILVMAAMRRYAERAASTSTAVP